MAYLGSFARGQGLPLAVGVNVDDVEVLPYGDGYFHHGDAAGNGGSPASMATKNFLLRLSIGDEATAHTLVWADDLPLPPGLANVAQCETPPADGAGFMEATSLPHVYGPPHATAQHLPPPTPHLSCTCVACVGFSLGPVFGLASAPQPRCRTRWGRRFYQFPRNASGLWLCSASCSTSSPGRGVRVTSYGRTRSSTGVAARVLLRVCGCVVCANSAHLDGWWVAPMIL